MVQSASVEVDWQHALWRFWRKRNRSDSPLNFLKVLCKRDAQLGKHTLLAGKIVPLNMIPGADVTLEIAGAQWTVATAPKTRPIPIVYNPYGGFGDHVDDN